MLVRQCLGRYALIVCLNSQLGQKSRSKQNAQWVREETSVTKINLLDRDVCKCVCSFTVLGLPQPNPQLCHLPAAHTARKCGLLRINSTCRVASSHSSIPSFFSLTRATKWVSEHLEPKHPRAEHCRNRFMCLETERNSQVDRTTGCPSWSVPPLSDRATLRAVLSHALVLVPQLCGL